MGSIEVQAAGARERVVAGPGDEVTVRLPENPTTGYSWEVPEGHEVVANEFSRQSAGGAGAGGERVVTLVVGEGAREATFRLVRPWDKAEPERTFTLTFTPPD